MKRISTLTIAIMLFTALVFSQSPSKPFSEKDTVIGKFYHNDKNIIATQLTPNPKIYESHWNGENLQLQLRETNKRGTDFRNKGSLNLVDLENKSVLWSRKLDYNSDLIRNEGSYLLLNSGAKTYVINPQTGENIWEAKQNFYFVDPVTGIGLAYPFSPTSNKMTAYDMRTGTQLWNQKLDRTYGWDDAYMYNDSTLIIAVKGLNVFNIRNGNNWRYEASTIRRDIGKTIAKNVAGIALGVLTGVYVYNTNLDVATEMVSNILIDPSGDLLQASRDKIARVDMNGSEKWSTPLPKDITSKSSLFVMNDVVYMINKGFAFYNGNFSMIGDPYFAAFDLNDGRQIYLEEIHEKKDFIRNFQVIDDLLFLVFQTKVATYSLSDGKFQKLHEFKGLDKGEELDAFFESDIFVKQTDSQFVDLSRKNPELSYIRTDEYRVFSLNDSLDVVEQFNKEHIYHKTVDYGDYTFITNDDKTSIILNAQYQPVAEIKTTSNMFIRKDKLYAVERDAIWETDLKQLQE